MQVAPGKNDEYTRVMTTDILPNYKKAGVKDFMVYTTNFGDAPQGRVVTVRGIPGTSVDVSYGAMNAWRARATRMYSS